VGQVLNLPGFMHSTVSVSATCPKCGGVSLACRYNYFDRGDLQVHAWEHKCPDCGWRETKAFRSDDPPRTDDVNPAVCPFCSRSGQA
jgi:predicted  nucleic acid-binding Zn-ribbon protein